MAICKNCNRACSTEKKCPRTGCNFSGCFACNPSPFCPKCNTPLKEVKK